MPEEDLETADLKESIDQRLEEHEHAEHAPHASHGKPATPSWTRYLSLSTAVIAVFAAVASLKSGANSNEAILAKSEAMLYEAQASDEWALYQSKSIKAALSEDVDNLWAGLTASGIKPAMPDPAQPAAPPAEPAPAAAPAAKEARAKEAPPDAASKLARLAKLGSESLRYRDESKEIETSARELENKVKEANERSDALMAHHERFAISVTLLQIAIALSAIAALTRLKPLWYLSMGVSVAGIIVFVIGWL